MATEGSGASRGAGEGLRNEDAFLVEDGLGLYVVCDGASGMPAGEIASRLATESLASVVQRSEAEPELRQPEAAWAVVEAAMRQALRSLAELERDDPDLRGLSTTITMMLAHREVAVLGHRGDSRAYLLRRRRAHQLTVDDDHTHAINGEWEDAPGFQVFGVALQPDDTFVLCSDGAEEVLGDPTITRVASDLPPRLLASRIVSEAHRRTPDSDATAVVVRVRGARERGWLSLSQPPRRDAIVHTLEPG